MPWPDVKLTVRLPVTDWAMALTLSSVLAFRFDRDRGESKDIELFFGSSEFVHFPHFTRGREGVENSGFGDSRLGIQRD